MTERKGLEVQRTVIYCGALHLQQINLSLVQRLLSKCPVVRFLIPCLAIGAIQASQCTYSSPAKTNQLILPPKSSDMRTILIEDNPQIRELIKSLLATHCPGVQVVGEAESIAEGRVLLSTVQADLWLLDIELRDGTVFELLDQLDPVLFENVGLVFLTAFSTFEYVIQALHKSAVDYLLKPVDPAQLKLAVEKVQKEISTRDLRQRLDELRNLLVRPETPTPTLDKLPVWIQKGAVSYINLNEILYLEGDGVLTYVHTFSEKPLTSFRNLGFYKDLLISRGGFITVSKKYLANSRHIARYEPGDTMVFLTNGTGIIASRRAGQQLLEFFRSVFG